MDELIGTLLGTHEARLISPSAKARARGHAFDPRRIELFEKLHDALRQFPPEPVRLWKPSGQAAANQAFFEAYFSNFIEGTEFAVDEARAIVFDGFIPKNRPADAHDILGAFGIVSDAKEMKHLPEKPEAFLALLRARHHTLMAGRPDTTPGEFKDRPNQFGTLIFVAPDEVPGTLTEGFRIYRRLSDPLHRAILMMFMVSEVHPFLDGNGRLARILMNVELAAADQVRVIIPIIYRSNYLSALRALSGNSWPEPIIKTLAFAQRYVAAIPWSDFPRAVAVLTRTNAFIRPEEGDEQGIRLRIPSAADVAEDGTA
jgi:hypothetical protein